MYKLIREHIHNRICKTLEKSKKVTKKELLNLIEVIYQDWEYIINNY